MVYKAGTELTGAVCSAPVHARDVRKRLPCFKAEKNVDDEQSVLSQQEQEDAEYEMKRELADLEGVAVTSSENAVRLDDAVSGVSDGQDVGAVSEELHAESVRDNERDVRIARQAVADGEHEHLMEKIQSEIEREIERARLLYMLENGRKNAIDAARARYGSKADIRSIQQAYDGIANNIDPQLNDITDMISMSIDNKLHGKSCVKMLMPNGSIRMMDADVALALSEIPKHPAVKSSGNNSVEEVATDVSDRMPESVIQLYSSEEIEKLHELSDIMGDNAKRQAAFIYKDPDSGEAEVKSMRELRLHKLGLPTVAMDYDYVYNLADNSYHNGRPLPSAMDAYDMQPMLQGNGKNYGFYK